MTRTTVHEYAAALRPRHRAAGKREKKAILDEFCRTTGLRRKAAIRLLNRVVGPRPGRIGRPRRYAAEVIGPLRQAAEVIEPLRQV